MTTVSALRILPICLISIASYSPVRAEWVDTVADARVEYRHDDNLNRSAFTVDERKDDIISGMVSAGRYYQLNDESANYTRLRLTADLELRTHSDFDLLDRTNIGATASLTHKLGLGADKPWIRVHTSVVSESVDDDDRDKEIYNMGVTLGKQYNARFGASIDVSYNTQNGKDDLLPISLATLGIGGEVYDLDRYSITADTNYRIAENWLVTGFYSYLSGELTGECTFANVARVVQTITITAHTLDNVFGGCRYRFDGRAHTFGLAGTYSLSSHSSINFGIQLSDGGRGGLPGQDDLSYDDEQYFLSFRYSL